MVVPGLDGGWEEVDESCVGLLRAPWAQRSGISWSTLPQHCRRPFRFNIETSAALLYLDTMLHFFTRIKSSLCLFMWKLSHLISLQPLGRFAGKCSERRKGLKASDIFCKTSF